MNGRQDGKSKLPVGLLLNLKKRKLFLAEDDTNHFDYLLYGNFDGVSFKTVEKWYGLAPTIEMDEHAADISSGTNFLSEPYISTFVLKLLFPQGSSDVSYDLAGYNYEYWKAVDTPGHEAQLSMKHPSCPYFAMVMINISGQLANEFANMDDPSRKLFCYFINAIRDSRKANNDFSTLNCGLFETLGYYDYILLIRAPALEPIVRLCDCIKSLQYDGRIPAVSTCYTVLGIDNWMKNAPQDAPPIHPITAESFVQKIEIAIQLCPGESMDLLRGALQKENITIDECRSHGETDALLIVEGDQLPNLLPQYLRGGVLNPNHEAYQNHILTKNTTFIFANGSHPSGGTPALRAQNPVDRASKSSYHSTFLEYKALRDRDRKSHRLTTALRQTVLRYLNLTQSGHAFELQYLLDPIFDSLFQNMARANKRLHELFADWELASHDSDARLQLQWDRARFWDEYDTALRSFRELVGGFLSDIALSDKYFIEDSQLKHPSIGSATKFIFMYNYLVDGLAREVNIVKSTTYTFLVKSGGSDDVAVTNLFNFLPITQENADHSEDCLLVIELPERVLYNIRVSLFAILHEMSHIVGYRGRMKRLEEIDKAVADHIAWLLSSPLSPQKELLDLLQSIFPRDGVPQEVRERLIAYIGDGMQDFQAKIYETIQYMLETEIESQYQSEEDPEENTGLFSREIIDELIDCLSQRLAPDFACTSCVFNTIYKEYNAMCEKIAQDFSQYLLEGNYIKPTFDLFARRMHLMAREDMQYGAHINQNLFVSLWTVFEALRGHNETETIDPSFIIEKFIDDCFYAMDEGFADCFAIKMLEMPIEDYIVCHCFMEEGMISDILSASDGTVLRISCVLQAAFDIKESHLPDSIKRVICNKVEYLNRANAFIIPLEADELIAQVEEILAIGNRAYSGNKMKEHIVTYLRCTIDASYAKAFARDPTSPNPLLNTIRTLYQCWKLDDTSEIQNQILDLWLKLSLDKRKPHTSL